MTEGESEGLVRVKFLEEVANNKHCWPSKPELAETVDEGQVFLVWFLET